jgi:predicted alpha/beta-hydrolase family hydrolase
VTDSSLPRSWPSRLRRAWIVLGTAALLVFTAWSLIAYRASPEAKAAMESDSQVVVTRLEGAWQFAPALGPVQATGLLFFAGSLVDPVAYAPLARAVAAQGFRATIMELPRRGAFGGADDPDLRARALGIMRERGGPPRWVVGGHSRGGVVASQLAYESPRALAGLVLIGTSHPRDVTLASLAVPVMKVAGTRDGLASPEEVRGNSEKLPPGTRWVWIEGGNHSQFGWYGFQPGDRRAAVSAERQRDSMIRAVLELLRAVNGNASASSRSGNSASVPWIP